MESEDGRGSSFIFTITLRKDKEGRRSAYVPAVDLRGMRALVIDDNETSRMLLSRNLESFSFTVRTAASGRDALEELEAAAQRGEPYELALMDWRMPGMDGIETARRIKEHPELSGIPRILMITAYGQEEAMQHAADAGIHSFLTKPVNQSVLFDTIMEVFGHEAQGRAPASIRDGREPEGMGRIRGARILLAEDNEINQQIAVELLETAGMVVETANNGVEAVAAVANSSYDLVFMDIQMPEMDGFEATREIRKQEGRRSVELPIVAMTAHAMTGDREKSLAVGMNDHITKPIDPEQLLKTLLLWIKPGERSLPEGFAPRSSRRNGAVTQDELPLKGLPGLNISSGLAKVSGNRLLYLKLLAQFGEKYSDAARNVGELLVAGKDVDATRLAHTIKGVAANLGADDLSRAAAEVERALKAGCADATHLLAAMEEELIVLRSSLQRLRRPPDGGGTSSAPREQPRSFDGASAAALARSVAAAVDNNLTLAVDKLQELLAISLPSNYEEAAKRAAEHLDNFDTDEAKAELEALAEKIEKETE